MIICPARLEPIFSPRPWGSLSLAPLFPEKSNLAEPLGEAWMTGSECRFADGPFAGKKLGEAWPEMPPEWTGTSVDRSGSFPLLVKFLFPEDKLSVQVHPDDDYASRHEQAAGGRGKTEMWYVMNARPRAEVLVGLKSGVTRESLERAIVDGMAENCLEHIPLRAGDAVFVPARTAHTIGPGLVLCEIQQNSDITYRVYDYNRRDAKGQPRPLHIQKALDVMRFGQQSGGKIVPVRTQEAGAEKTYFASCRYFETTRWEFSEPARMASLQSSYDLLIFLEGTGTIQWGGEHASYAPAQVWMVPAALGPFEVAPGLQTTLLRTYVPRQPGEFGPALTQHGVSEAEWSRLVHR
jgi:mannose-6-phosphate isomerase